MVLMTSGFRFCAHLSLLLAGKWRPQPYNREGADVGLMRVIQSVALCDRIRCLSEELCRRCTCGVLPTERAYYSACSTLHTCAVTPSGLGESHTGVFRADSSRVTSFAPCQYQTPPWANGKRGFGAAFLCWLVMLHCGKQVRWWITAYLTQIVCLLRPDGERIARQTTRS